MDYLVSGITVFIGTVTGQLIARAIDRKRKK